MKRSEPVPSDSRRWNHNVQYHRVILRALGTGRGRLLDLGCGQGILAQQLQRVADHVTAIDLDPVSVDLARRADPGGDIDYVVGDFLTHPFAPASFDAVVSVAALHHMDARPALGRMRELLRPAGTLVVVGLARSRFPADTGRDAAAVLVNLAHRTRKGYWEHSAPTVWPPPLTYAEMRRLAARELPGVRYRRHLLWRYSLIWTKPGTGASR